MESKHSILSIGDKIVLNKKIKNGEITEYFSRIQDFYDTTKMVISMPMEKSVYIPLKVGEIFSANFYANGNLYNCKVEVEDRFKKEGKYYVVIKFNSELEKIQRREYYRLEYIAEVCFSKMEEDDEDDIINFPDEIQWENAILTDISGGGMRFNSRTKIDNQKRVILKFSFSISGERKEIVCKALIRGIDMIPNQQNIYEYRVSFDDLKNNEREDIVKFIFEEERRRRKIDRS